MRLVAFHRTAFDDYSDWAKTDKNYSSAFGALSSKPQRHHSTALANLSRLSNKLKGYWSRRLTDEHRLVYKVTDEYLIVVSCKYHYE